jgi:hypothetical protein
MCQPRAIRQPSLVPPPCVAAIAMPCAGCPSCDALPSFIGRLIPKERGREDRRKKATHGEEEREIRERENGEKKGKRKIRKQINELSVFKNCYSLIILSILLLGKNRR